MREDSMAAAAAWSLRLGGIGGTDTN